MWQLARLAVTDWWARIEIGIGPKIVVFNSTIRLSPLRRTIVSWKLDYVKFNFSMVIQILWREIRKWMMDMLSFIWLIMREWFDNFFRARFIWRWEEDMHKIYFWDDTFRLQIRTLGYFCIDAVIRIPFNIIHVAHNLRHKYLHALNFRARTTADIDQQITHWIRW